MPVFDNGLRYSLGFNPTYFPNKYFALEGQLGIGYEHSETFISGIPQKIHSLNALGGARVYIISKEKFKSYFNILGGLNQIFETREYWEGDEFKNELVPGFAIGGFIESQSFQYGLIIESEAHLALKIGYKF